jgi:hypothetical protein
MLCCALLPHPATCSDALAAEAASTVRLAATNVIQATLRVLPPLNAVDYTALHTL